MIDKHFTKQEITVNIFSFQISCFFSNARGFRMGVYVVCISQTMVGARPAGLPAQTTVPIFISTFALALQLYLKIMNLKRYASIVA